MFRTRKAIIAISPWQLNANTQSYFGPFFQLHCVLKHSSKTDTVVTDGESDLCKSVDYSSGRCGVIKHHGNSHDVIQQPGM